MRLSAIPERCSGCRACTLVCALTNQKLNNPKYGAISVIPHFPAPGRFELRFCTNCGACRDACPTGAIKEQPDGSFRVEPEECIGCGICVEACPEGVCRMILETNVAFVCVQCGECVKYCPKEALVDADQEVKRA